MAETIQTAGLRMFKKKTGHQIGPSKWASARLRYVTGELSSFRDVASWLGCVPETVQRRATLESWANQRQKHADNVTEQVERLGRAEAVELTSADLAQLSSVRAGLASSALRFGSDLVRSLSGLKTRLDAEPDADKLHTLARTQGLLLDQLCRLAGLPDPGRASAPRPSTARETEPDTRQPELGPIRPIDEPTDDAGADAGQGQG
jgi:hypothetical protein